MESTQVPVTLTCLECGAKVSFTDTGDENTMLICDECGTEVGTKGKVRSAAKQHVAESAKDALRKALQDATKGMKNVKFKKR